MNINSIQYITLTQAIRLYQSIAQSIIKTELPHEVGKLIASFNYNIITFEEIIRQMSKKN
jgi:hypothetical protein